MRRIDLSAGVVRSYSGPMTETVARPSMQSRARWQSRSVLATTIFLEVEVMREQQQTEDETDEIVEWEAWP